ncbi:MAG: ABC-F family ATP-binding cassette domain-containing protein [Armatimonadota bacterium]|nr:ABC-F family ATP-binding cassette domain-containing protein [Armatimonadota bacterium]MDR7454514.1 ABC-F family ATP-binding cassette domain-containing protein [Armatimonadota bacterium]MDR7456735.1 ABC-F family ATP-binding cassette domain-containing protein [Armatimonadota bacterium]MDR7497449.1 ABC-F family ATP-binding cassette domain-containing protein [Armatimonadota bacterium]MDR7510467.1 ABC-F family ATP-binding cassette domain-containing protein [Armatimonadota bacterium]
MPVLTVTDLARSHADLEVLRGVSFSLEARERVALVGRNGSGKTTLLRVLAGLDAPDRGRVSLAAWAKLAYLPQAPEGEAHAAVLEHVLAGATDVRTLEARLRELEQRMAAPEVHDDPERLATVMEEYAHVHEHYEHAGGFTLEVRAKMVLGGLGFREGDWTRPLGVLSGGWRMRAELARALLGEPDVLLLDEPTNHLDLATTEWLEAYLQAFPGACLIVSHDRYLLDAVTSRTLDLEEGLVESYPGPYSTYVALKAERARLRQEAWERQQEEIARLEDYIRRYKAGQRAAQAHSREKMLARVEAQRVDAPRRERAMRVRLTSAPGSGRLVARLRRVTKAFDGRRVLTGVTLEIHRGERIGLLGPNGAGKSTLLRLIAGLEEPTEGTVTLGTGVRPRYVAQEATDVLDPERTVLDEVLTDRPMLPEQVRGYLGRFLFTGEDVFKRVAMLSGGERQRLSLAKLLLDEPNLLLLDEPTNHLDIPAREALEAALREFPGTMIVATHDRYLLERLATRILTVDADGVSDFQGTYRELRERRDRGAGEAAGTPPRSPARTPRQVAAPAASLTFDQVAAQIAAIERERDEAAAWLGDPDLYRDRERATAMRRRYEDAERRLVELYALLEQIEAGRG